MRSNYLSMNDDESKPRLRSKLKHKSKLGRWIILVVLWMAVGIVVLGGIFWTYAHSSMSGYFRFNGGNKMVAQVCITPTRRPHEMHVHIVLLDSNGNQNSDPTYLIKGDKLLLQGDTITYPMWLNWFDLYSGTKLTYLEGYNNDGSQASTPMSVNGGDDSFFRNMQGLPPVLETSYTGPRLSISGDGKPYTILLSHTGTYTRVPNQSGC